MSNDDNIIDVDFKEEKEELFHIKTKWKSVTLGFIAGFITGLLYLLISFYTFAINYAKI